MDTSFDVVKRVVELANEETKVFLDVYGERYQAKGFIFDMGENTITITAGEIYERQRTKNVDRKR